MGVNPSLFCFSDDPAVSTNNFIALTNFLVIFDVNHFLNLIGVKLSDPKLCTLVAIISCVYSNIYAQQKTVAKLSNYVSALNNIRELKPVEKLYLQTDKPYYGVGDTLRFKGYLLNADYLTPAAHSGLLYVELFNEQGKSAKRIMVPVTSGLAWGNIALDSTEIPNGTYT